MSFSIKANILTLLILLTMSQVNAHQNERYCKLLRKAEKCIIEAKLDSSLCYYTEAFETYNYPFVRDVVSAVFVAMYNHDENQFNFLLKYLLRKGMSRSELSQILSKVPDNFELDSYENDFDKYNGSYLKAIDYDLSNHYLLLDKYSLAYHKGIINREDNMSFDYKYTYEVLSAMYVDNISKYGFPTEQRIGVGATSFIVKRNNVREGYESKDFCYDSIMFKVPDKYIFNSSYTKRTSLIRAYYRTGNYFLWHMDIKGNQNLDSVLFLGVRNLSVYPHFYASCLERGGVDYGLSWESAVNQKYGFDIKKIIKKENTELINERRAKLGLRSIEMDLQLFNAIAKLEKLRYKDYFARRVRGKSLFFYSLFVSMIP